MVFSTHVTGMMVRACDLSTRGWRQEGPEPVIRLLRCLADQIKGHAVKAHDLSTVPGAHTANEKTDS